MKLIIFSDFDGTITTQDTGVILIDLGMGYEGRKALDAQVLNGTLQFRNALDVMWKSVNLSWEDAMKELDNVELDPHFLSFYLWVKDQQFPFTILSSGLIPIVEHFMKRDVGKNDSFKIHANEVTIHQTHWELTHVDDSPYGHDKGTHLRRARKDLNDEEKIVFIGDGISDLSAAMEADIVFAKKGKDLETWCIKKNIKYVPWENFSTILDTLKSLK
ncbi:hypothetical protein HDV02_005544 [Globomyces sp. JEL0801]|nr:hypothetical protein HDV02_005544 [Globomyces sp. JEL0801]